MKAQTRQTAPVEIAACEDAPPARASRRPPTTSNQDSFHSCFHLEGICYPHMGPRTLGRLREPSIREEPRGTEANYAANEQHVDEKSMFFPESR